MNVFVYMCGMRKSIESWVSHTWETHPRRLGDSGLVLNSSVPSKESGLCCYRERLELSHT